MNISVVGLGKLGACSASCFSSKGYKVIGLDKNKNFVDAINSGKAPVKEPLLQETIDLSRGNLTATYSYDKIISETDVTFIIVPTPSMQNGHFSNDYMIDVLTNISECLKKSEKEYHLIVITSTVSPTSIEKVFVPMIENISGRKLNEGFGICYNPEFIALGSVISDFLNPDMLLIGESDTKAGNILEEIYRKTCDNKPYFARMSMVSAEITKISLNAYVTMKISYANTLANICELIPGSNIDDITRALGSDKRISPYYLKGGLGYGGPCFPRDNRAFASFAKDYGYDALLAKTVDKVNEFQTQKMIEKVIANIDVNSRAEVAILGLAYKLNTPVIEESPAIKIIDKLLDYKTLTVNVYDKLANDSAKQIFGDKIKYYSSLEEILKTADIVIITLQSSEFKLINSKHFSKDKVIIIDGWRVLNNNMLDKKIKYIPVGIKD